MPMDNEYFQDWLAVIDNLGDAQRAGNRPVSPPLKGL